MAEESDKRKVSAEPQTLGDNAGVYIPTQEPSNPKLAFGDFVMSLGTSAYVSLGKIQDPAFGQMEPDIDAASQIVEILEMLGEKTKGNLDKEEEKLLGGLLYELRIAIVESR
ncbi:DUF1844 domain-containing protein [Microvenator marinus]|jgi:hypothetical protein|uniref:DUF1844 domain-containing protein n=1 Tax=Microvenator marinus TaxID=2600177 RepID=A0A5B8XQ27_9DELT|nr:DUF1844 domain-containing protein [Microvenator marinus]QED27197.1 DUF1844 domain-containing protein [Microvenator marinus]